MGLSGRIRQTRQVCRGAISDWMPAPRSRGIAGSRRSSPTARLFAGDGARKKSQKTARGAHNLSLGGGRLGRERRWQSGCRWFNPIHTFAMSMATVNIRERPQSGAHPGATARGALHRSSLMATETTTLRRTLAECFGPAIVKLLWLDGSCLVTRQAVPSFNRQRSTIE